MDENINSRELTIGELLNGLGEYNAQFLKLVGYEDEEGTIPSFCCIIAKGETAAEVLRRTEDF